MIREMYLIEIRSVWDVLIIIIGVKRAIYYRVIYCLCSEYH